MAQYADFTATPFYMQVVLVSIRNKNVDMPPRREWKRCHKGHATDYSKQDYPHARRGFISPNYSCAWSALKTLWVPNIETPLVYTHLFAVLGFGWCLAQMFPVSSTPRAPMCPADLIVACVAADIFTCSASVARHLWQARSKELHERFRNVDNAGVALVVITTVFVIDVNTAPPQQSVLQGWNHFIVAMCCLIAAVLVSRWPWLLMSNNQALVWGCWYVVCCVWVLPLLITLWPGYCGWRGANALTSFAAAWISHRTQFPERACPQLFLSWSPSHTISHVAYAAGLYFTHAALADKYLGCVPWERPCHW